MKLALTHIVVVILILICFPSLMGMGADILEWSALKFPDIALPNITTRDSQVSNSSSLTLTTTGDAEISADNTTAVQLTHATSGDTLVTEYKLTFDNVGGTTGVGTGEGGGDEWQLYNVFLTTGTEGDVTWVPDDNDVKVTLSVRASNYSGQLADAGDYSAAQTLTVFWVGP